MKHRQLYDNIIFIVMSIILVIIYILLMCNKEQCRSLTKIEFEEGKNYYLVRKSIEPEKNKNHDSFEITEIVVGRDSRYSDDKIIDIFESSYKDHEMEWEGEIIYNHSRIGLDINNDGIVDLSVKLSNKKDGYYLLKGQRIRIKFIMDELISCSLPYYGIEAEIIYR